MYEFHEARVLAPNKSAILSAIRLRAGAEAVQQVSTTMYNVAMPLFSEEAKAVSVFLMPDTADKVTRVRVARGAIGFHVLKSLCRAFGGEIFGGYRSPTNRTHIEHYWEKIHQFPKPVDVVDEKLFSERDAENGFATYYHGVKSVADAWKILTAEGLEPEFACVMFEEDDSSIDIMGPKCLVATLDKDTGVLAIEMRASPETHAALDAGAAIEIVVSDAPLPWCRPGAQAPTI